MFNYQENAAIAMKLNHVILLACMCSVHASRMPECHKYDIANMHTLSALSSGALYMLCVSSEYIITRNSGSTQCTMTFSGIQLFACARCCFAVMLMRSNCFRDFPRMFGAAHIILPLIERERANPTGSSNRFYRVSIRLSATGNATNLYSFA